MNPTTSERSFPMAFVVITAFMSSLLWLAALLNHVPVQ